MNVLPEKLFLSSKIIKSIVCIFLIVLPVILFYSSKNMYEKLLSKESDVSYYSKEEVFEETPTEILAQTSENLTEVIVPTTTVVKNTTSQKTAPQAKKAPVDTSLPVRLIIPAINVDAKIEYVALTTDGAIGTPKGPSTVAWFRLGARPGEEGTAIIVGHYGTWKNGSGSVFDNLSGLKAGNVIYVKDSKGLVKSFTVRENHVYEADDPAPEVFNQGQGVHLNLITCNGDWVSSEQTFTKRLVIFTDLN